MGGRWYHSLLYGLTQFMGDSLWCFLLKDPTQRGMEPWVFFNMVSPNVIMYLSRESICSLYHIREWIFTFQGFSVFCLNCGTWQEYGISASNMKGVCRLPKASTLKFLFRMKANTFSYKVLYSYLFSFYFLVQVFILLLMYSLSPYSGVVMLTTLRILFYFCA